MQRVATTTGESPGTNWMVPIFLRIFFFSIAGEKKNNKKEERERILQEAASPLQKPVDAAFRELNNSSLFILDQPVIKFSLA